MTTEDGQGESGEGTGLFCYRDQIRLCNASCMAFLPKVPEGKDYIGEQWAHCLELVSKHRTGKHLAILASVASEDVVTRRRAAAAPSVKVPGAG